MKIAEVVSTPPFAWTTGGPARAVYDLSKSLAHRGHKVTILTTNLFHGDSSSGRNNAPEIRNGVSLRYFSVMGGYLAWKYKAYFSPGLLVHLMTRMKTYDVVHLQDLISPQAVVTVFSSRLNHVPCVLTPHGCIPWLCRRNIVSRLYYRLFGFRILKNAVTIIALTGTEKKELCGLCVPEEKIVVIPNGITLSDYETLPEKGLFRKRYHIADHEKMILFLGRVNRIKGIDLLVDAFSTLVDDHPSFRLVIAGRDEGFLKELKEQADRLAATDRIVFTGQLGEEEKRAAYTDADVYVLPSVHEGFPITVLEAMACGTPVIVTKGCNISEVVEGCGLVVDNDRDSISGAILTMLEDNGLREHLATQGRLKVRNEFSWDSIAKKIEAAYRECLGESRTEFI